MPRQWGVTRAFVVELDQFPTGGPFVYNGQTYLTTVVEGSVTWQRILSQIGNGAATFYATDNWEQFLVPGRVLVIEKLVNLGGGISRLVACFLMEEVEPATNGGISQVHVRGPGIEGLLNKQTVWEPIGGLTANTTTLAVSIAGPDARELAVAVPPGNETIQLDSTNSDNVKQEIRITLDNGGEHVTVITERKEYLGEWHLVLRDRLPSAASAGNAVIIRARRFRVNNVAGFIPGAEVVIAHGGNTHWTTISNDPIEDANRVTMDKGIPFAVPSGTTVINSNRFSPATDDVTQIVAKAPGWTVTFQTGNGTAVGTSHIPHGESVFELLSSVAERTGEFFRYHITDGNYPTKTIQWRRSPDSSGMTLILYDTDEEARQAADEMSLTKGGAFSMTRRRTLPLVTKLYPAAGDQQVSLAEASAAARSFATSMGCAVNTGAGLYEPDYVTHVAGLADYGVHEVQQTYGDISLTDAKSPEARAAAADQLLVSAVQTLVTAQMREYYSVEAYVPVPLRPGQTVKIENLTRVEPHSTTTADWIILDVTERIVNGRPRTTLHVSNMIGTRWTPAMVLASRLRSVIQSQRRTAATAGTAVVVSGGGSSGGGTTDHGALTGLGDDDHPQYLLASGARPLASNLPVNPGVTIDGVDISTHAANADAHHPRVTAADASLVVNGSQGVRVADGFAGAGLGLAGGILGVNVATAQGTAINSDTVAVAPAAGGGLQNTAAGLGVKLPQHSGLVTDSSGAALGPPLTVSSTSPNQVSGSGHGHAVDSTDNAKATPGKLLKGSALGDLILRNLTADRVTTPVVETAAGGLRLDPANGVTTNDGNLSFVGARQIDTDSGSLTLAPAQTLVLDPADNVAQVAPTTTLKTAHAAVGTFPQTGWQIDYDGDSYFTSILADELHVQSFIADIMRVKVGGEYIPESMALISRDFTIPAVGASSTLYVEDVPGWQDIAAYAENDWILLRVVDRSGGGLVVANAWGQVTSYNNLAGGEQSWTFTTRIATTAVNRVARRGDLALDYGKSGSYWWYAQVLDPGGPHAGFGRWTGANPTEGVEYPIRLGQLRGVSGVNELGFQTGVGASTRTRFTELRNEIHGSRLSLYAGDGGRLQVSAVEVQFWRSGSQSSTLVADSDGTAVNVETTGGNYWSTVDEAVGSANHGDYVSNSPNMSGALFVGLTNPAAFSSIFRIDIRAALRSTGLSNDTVELYGQVFAADEVTPLTGEVLLAARTTNTTATVTTTAPHEGFSTVTAAEWNGARLRLRWKYEINANEEAIRLDPSIPSLAIGNPLPTGCETGGAGLWAGLESGVYKARIGNPLGAQLTYDGNGLLLSSGTTGAQINLNPTTQSIALGNPLPTGTQTGGHGFWAGLLSGTAYGLRIGAPHQAGSQLLYDGTSGTLSLRATIGSTVVPMIVFEGDGESYFGGPMRLGVGGGIWQGTGTGATFANPKSGWKLWRDGAGAGRFETYNASGAAQVGINANGQLIAGAGMVALDANGLTIGVVADPTPQTAIKFSGVADIAAATIPESFDSHQIAWSLYNIVDPQSYAAQIKMVADETYGNGHGYLALWGGDVNINATRKVTVATSLYASKGVMSGWTQGDTANRGQFISDLAGAHDFESVVLLDTTDINHGMTSVIANTAAYGSLSKAYAAPGGLAVRGFSEDAIALHLQGFATSTHATNNTTAGAAVTIDGSKKNGPTVTALAAAENILAVRSNGATQLIVKGNGDLYINGATSSYDTYDDPALLRALSRELDPAGIIRDRWDEFVAYQRADLEAAGILDGMMVNQTALARLLTGAVWQLAKRLAVLEMKYT